MTPRDAIPRRWLDFLTPEAPLGIGMDIATSDGPTSNPASITVSQAVGGLIYERLVIAWKTRDEAVATAMLGTVLEDIRSLGRLQIRGICLDASNERFFCQRLARQFHLHGRFQLIGGGENLTYQGQTLRAKEMLGNLYVNAHTDGLLCTPEAPFLKEDRRLVQKSKGLFVTLTGKGGKHGDTFDSGKLARWALLSSGTIQAAAAPLTTFGSKRTEATEDDPETRTEALNA
jgi:hypothetical protein